MESLVTEFKLLGHILGRNDDIVHSMDEYSEPLERAKKYFKESTRRRVFVAKVLPSHYLCVLRINNIKDPSEWEETLDKLVGHVVNLKEIVFYGGLTKYFDIGEYLATKKVEATFYDCGENKKIPTYQTTTLMDYTFDNIPQGWEEFFNENKSIISELSKELEKRKEETIYPPLHLIYNAFCLCPPSKVKVIIIGQDPYPHNPGEAMGLAFSVPSGVKIPKSLQNIFTSLKNEGYKFNPTNGDLTSWAKKGLLLINTALTVKSKEAGSHSHLWAQFFTRFMGWADENIKNTVWVLWGKHAKEYKTFIHTQDNGHKIVTKVHPVNMGAGNLWFKTETFSPINAELEKIGKKPIDWNLV